MYNQSTHGDNISEKKNALLAQEDQRYAEELAEWELAE